MFHRCLFACCPDGRRGNTEQVVPRWRLPGASSVSRDMLHWAMLHTLLQCTRMAINMVCNRGTFARRRRLFLFAVIVAKDHVMVHYNELQARLLFSYLSSTILYLIGFHWQQWMPFWPPLLPTDESNFDNTQRLV